MLLFIERQFPLFKLAFPSLMESFKKCQFFMKVL